MRILLLLLGAALIAVPAQGQTLKALFDNTLNETAGNADWIVDVQQPVPVPAQSGITPSTSESFWLGAVSAWGVELVKRGFTVHTLTTSYGITYGNGGNPYDLANYDLFVVCEPQNPFTVAEKEAIRLFVQNGGGLMMVADHNASDRDSDGWDSPEVWNDLGIDTAFGLHFQSAGESNNSFTQVSTNVSTLPGDSIIGGQAGTVTALSYHAGTSVRLLTANNPTAAGHVWMNGASHGATQIMAATARYGSGRVGAVGDSSPADDGTGQSGNTLYNGWGEAGATDDILFLNMSLWLASGGAVAAPGQATLSAPPNGATGVGVPTTLRWVATPTADRYQVQLSTDSGFASTILDDSTLTDTSRAAAGLAQNTTYYWRVRARNIGGWGSLSTIWNFGTWTVPAQAILLNPADGETGTPVPTVFSWQSVAGAIRYQFELDTTLAFTQPLVVDSSLGSVVKILDGLERGRAYVWRVRAGNAAGWGPFSDARGFTTWVAPGQVGLVFPADSAQGIPEPVQCVWLPQPGATAYQLELSSDAAFTSILLSDSSLTDTTRSVAGVDTLATLFWRVRAKNAAGWGPLSDVRQFRIAAALNLPVTIGDGWRIVSLPVMPADPRGTTVFPSAGSAFYAYDAGYVARDSLSAGAGYWARFTTPGLVTISGEPVTRDSIEVNPGWNLVGSISAPVAAAAVQSIPPGILALPFYAFQDGYTAAGTLVPGQGYWVRCAGAGKIILQQATAR